MPVASSGEDVNVLLVEDDELVRGRLEGLLGAARFHVYAADSCASARSMARALTFPLVVIDRELPDGDGIELIAELRRLYAPSKIFIMLFTVHDGPAEIARGLAAGADDYLSKRSTDEHILQRLHLAQRIVRLTK